MATTHCYLDRMMKKVVISISCSLVLTISMAQHKSLPENISNQSVVLLQKNKQEFIYTFFGLDSSKKWSGVHNKVFRMELQTGNSKQRQNVPDSFGRLASSASVIHNKAYIAGGYSVMADGKEKSSHHLFVFDPTTENFTIAANLPIPIDDHVQAVWRYRLLYVISGWNDSLNVLAVQVYDPQKNEWHLATSLPDEKTAAVFGGCGTIVGDTIYLLGGAQFAKNYPPSQQFYKGAIDPQNPLQIKWINAGNYPLPHRYRSVAFARKGKVYFYGGSNETYNYNAIAYADKKSVDPNKTVLIYSILTGQFSIRPIINSRMDLRNIVQSSNGKFYLVGGMGQKQTVLSTIVEAK